MKKASYPKIYATYLGVFLKEWKFQPTYRDYLHRFECVETGEIIEANHFSRSGSTPIRMCGPLAFRHETKTERKKRLSQVFYKMMPIGTKVKLYKRNNSWYYRHIGQ